MIAISVLTACQSGELPPPAPSSPCAVLIYMRDAVLRTSELRLRPIVMTKLICIAGLIPLMLFGGDLWYGLAVAIASGLLFGILITLGLIPVLYEWCFTSPRWPFARLFWRSNTGG